MKKIHFLIAATLLLLQGIQTNVFSQEAKETAEITAKVVDNGNAPIKGIPVYTVRSKQFTKTDAEGRFTLTAKMADLVVIDVAGYSRTTAAVELGKLTEETIMLAPTGSLNPDKKIQVGFGMQEFNRTTGSVAVISGDELRDVPTVFLKEAMAGRLAGVTSSVANTSPEWESYNLSLWGNELTDIWVDGAPQELVETADEIDNIYIGKDLASSSLFGGTASNGVMMVETKRGVAGDGNVSLKYNTGTRTAAFLPEMMNAVDYAKFSNQALQNDGLQAVFSDEAIAAYQNGSDPIRYPNVNYYDEFLKKSSRYDHVTGDFSGGSNTARYFAHLGYYSTDGLDKKGIGRDYTRLRVKSNLMIKLNDFGELDFGIGGSFSERNYAKFSSASMFGIMSSYPSNAVPLILADSIFGYSSQYPQNLLVNMAHSSVANNNTRDGYTRLGLNLDFGSLLKGLTFKTAVNISIVNSLTKEFNPSANLVEPIFTKTSAGTDTTISIVRQTFSPDNSWSRSGDEVRRNYYVYGGFNYDRQYGENHKLTMDLITSYRIQNGSALQQDVRLQNTGVRANYALLDRYVLEGTLNRSGTQSLLGDNQYGTFYSAGAAWIVSNESYLQDVEFINYLKFRGNYGKTGIWFSQLNNDPLTYFLSRDLYAGSGSYLFGRDGRTSSAGGYRRTFTGNPDIKWPERYTRNIGFDLQVLNKSLLISMNIFNQKTVDDVILPTNIYAFLSQNRDYMPYVNYGERINSGYDIQASYTKNFGDFGVRFGANMMNRILTVEKGNYLEYPEEGRNVIGNAGDLIMGLKADGLFESEDQIASALPQQFGQVSVGDIKYLDANNDNVINEKDMVEIGHANRMFYGVNLTIVYRNFTLGLHGNGAAGGQLVDNKSWNRGINNYQASVTERLATGELPRSTMIGGDNNYRNSSFWLKDASYFNLSSANVAYSIPSNLSKKAGIEKATFFLAGKNLWLSSSLDEMYAPAINSGYSMYPVMSSFELGVEIMF